MSLRLLKNLSKRNDIVVKSADKGGAVVVWRSDLYQKEALRQLSDTSLSQKNYYYLWFRYCFCFFACRYLIVSFHYLKFVRGIVNYL